MPVATNGGLTRNEIAALDTIRVRGQATRGDVASAIGLSTAMTARVVGRLASAGLVHDAGRMVIGGRGRQAEILELRPDAAYVVGIDVGTEVVHLIVADALGVPHAYREVPSQELAGKSQPEIVAAIADLARGIVAAADLPWRRVAAAGVAITGIIDGERGVCIVRSHTPGWEDFAVSAQLGAALDVPVVLDEMARAKSMAELRLGTARGCQNFIYVDAGMAIGAGIVIDGRPLRGMCGLAGEIGHVTIDPNGRLCRCGNRGCIQASASARALVAQARDQLHRGVYSSLSLDGPALTLEDIAAAARGGDKLALGLLNQAGEGLGEAISMALNLLGLDLVVVGGVLAHCSPVVLDAAARIVRLRVLPIVPRPRNVVLSTLGSDAAARGIVLHAIEWLFHDPVRRVLHRAADPDRRRAAAYLAVASG